MSLNQLEKDVLASTITFWFQNFGGTCALDVARDLSLDHTLVMQIFEQLTSLGYGSMNKHVELYQVSFDPENMGEGFKSEPVITHIFFPSKQALGKAFYSSELPRQNIPEYTKRLYLGAHQIGLVFFEEEVLARYLKHPELYEINDSLAGGDISSLLNTPDDRYLYVRYGKCLLKSGNIAVTAIYKDLSDMGKAEQRYWHSFELDAPNIDKSDDHFQKFLARTYEGEFVDFENPISRLLEAVVAVNKAVEPDLFFVKKENIHLQLPVEQTYKSYCDSASELYKIVGPDNLSQPAIKKLLAERFEVSTDKFKHNDSQRPLSTMQLVKLLEEKLGHPALITEQISRLSKLRVDADHKILDPESEAKSYSRALAKLCNDLSQALEQLAQLLA